LLAKTSEIKKIFFLSVLAGSAAILTGGVAISAGCCGLYHYAWSRMNPVTGYIENFDNQKVLKMSNGPLLSSMTESNQASFMKTLNRLAIKGGEQLDLKLFVANRRADLLTSICLKADDAQRYDASILNAIKFAECLQKAKSDAARNLTCMKSFDAKREN
jgi:hypothetical protein